MIFEIRNFTLICKLISFYKKCMRTEIEKVASYMRHTTVVSIGWYRTNIDPEPCKYGLESWKRLGKGTWNLRQGTFDKTLRGARCAMFLQALCLCKMRFTCIYVDMHYSGCVMHV